MPIIGQQSHAHFTPIAAAILQRITSSFVYKYNVTQSAFRVTVVSTYRYNVNYLLSTTHVYFYHLNPTGAVGPTRLYLRAVINSLPNLPTVENSTLTPNKNVDAQTVNRTLSLIRGGSQSSLVLTSNATTALQRYYFSRFVSDTLSGITSITANNWTFNFAVKESDTNANFPGSGTNQPVRIVGCVWRPSTQNTVGDIIDANSSSTTDEASTLETVQTTTFSGTQVLGVQDGDVLCFEVWFEVTQSAANAYTDTFYFDGTTVNTIKNSTVTSHASYLETPQGLVFGAPLARVTKPTIQKYNIVGRIRLQGLYKYNIAHLAALVRNYRYQIFQSAILFPVYRYNVVGRISKLSITKYNILVRKQAPKIFRYAINSRTHLSRIYRYNVANRITPAPVSTIYKYNIANRVTLPQSYQYSIVTKVILSRVYRYAISGRAAISRTIRYNIANRVTLPRIYRYPVAVKITAPKVYKYAILNRLLSSKVYRYSIVTRSSLSRLYRYNVARRVTVPQVYKYNLTSFGRVVVSSVYKYNVLRRLSPSFSRIHRYNILSKISVPRVYRYGLTVRATASRIYRYPILKAVTLSRIYRYNLLVRILSTRNYRYNLLQRLQRPRLYLYNLAKRISIPRIYRYGLGTRLSLTRIYHYNVIGRLSKISKYRYAIATFPSNILWQLTGQATDFPASLENLVSQFIKDNWSITDPLITTNPAITTASTPQHQAQVDNFAYDNFRSYYIRVKEIASEVKNRQVRLNTYEFASPIELELYSRRLKKGEAFAELNNMMNELLRIFGTYESGSGNGIFGIEGITLDRITSMEKERPPATNLWARRLRIILHYYRISIVG